MINKVFLEVNLNQFLNLKKQMKKIFYLKSPRNLKEHPQNIDINLRLMNIKLIKIFLRKIIYFKLKSMVENPKFSQIQIKLRWILGFKNKKQLLNRLMTMLLRKIQKVQAVSIWLILCQTILRTLWILCKDKYINKKVLSRT